ncbi:MAG: CHASE2 and HATPase_c domain-containing protein [Burkholderiaceae bacterium]
MTGWTMMPRYRLLIEWWTGLLLLLALAMNAAWQSLDGAQIGKGRFESAVYDGLSRLVPQPTDDRLLIVDIDDDSLEQIGRWPWPRAVHAEMLRRLVAGGARVIGLDLLLIDAAGDDALLADEFVRAASAGSPVVIPIATTRADNGEIPLYPVPEIGLKARLGHPHFRLDGDGMVRGLWLEEGGFPALSLALASEVAGDALPAGALRARALATPAERERTINSGQWESHGFTLLPRLSQSFERVSFGAVLRGEIPPRRFAGRIVLIGASAAGLGDRYATGLLPGTHPLPGVDLHAAATKALLDDALIRPLQPWQQFALTAIPVLLLLAALYRLPPRAGLLVTIGALALMLAMAALLLRAGHWWSPIGALAAGLLAYPLWSWRRLEAATAGLVRQAQALDRNAPSISGTRADVLPTEPVARQLERLGAAAARAVHLRQFLLQSLERLPCPALIVGEDERLLYANAKVGSDMRRTPAPGTAIPDWLQEQVGLDIGAVLDPASPPGQAELVDREGRHWLVDSARFDDPEWSRVRLIQFVDVSPIRAAQREREQTLRFLSHDLRSPQVTILSIIDLQARERTLPPWLEDIRREATRSLELANGFVELARAEGAVITFDTIDLVNLIEEARDACWRAAQQRGARIATHGMLQLAWTHGDSQLIRRALVNLIDNAIKYGPRGGTITVELSRERDMWCVAVSDQGPGLSADEIAHLFEPYWRGKARDKPGIGLGLSFVRVVADRHHGSIGVRAAEDGGACFEFRLPAREEPVDDPDQASASALSG